MAKSPTTATTTKNNNNKNNNQHRHPIPPSTKNSTTTAAATAAAATIVPTSSNEILLSNFILNSSNCGVDGNPWIVVRRPGERMKVSIIDYSWKARNLSSTECEIIAYFIEKPSGQNVPICSGDIWSFSGLLSRSHSTSSSSSSSSSSSMLLSANEHNVLVSDSERLEIKLPKRNVAMFIIRIQC
ncbi:hypothetical protein HELRODRAFT_168429 [Helobdella robusta]|uniref:Uncharacterized protein n=1 Tax=Helobdella robusta TaxID=6412 RepID=T1F0K9_HELRO|nr:hypothetical protein HELRODRAFT_168429 [Helobdella robusta]ESO09445.1 hypothetical protein HELRODRAFT_168429 [Helobdella robusta]